MKKIKNLLCSFVQENDWWHRFAWARALIGGHWVKTKERGWISHKAYEAYLGLKFDPILLKEELYEIKNPAP